jgi:protein-tyrosine-phosphatase
MALGFFESLANGRAVAYSGGSAPAEQVNPAAVAAMAEVGIDISGTPKRWSEQLIEQVDVVVTMGCGDECPFFPGTRYEDWTVRDPAGEPLDVVREIRDDIEARVRALLAELNVSE